MFLKFFIFTFLQILVFIPISKQIEVNENNRFLMSSDCKDLNSVCTEYLKKGYCTHEPFAKNMRSNIFLIFLILIYVFSIVSKIMF